MAMDSFKHTALKQCRNKNHNAEARQVLGC